jgi:hypothetical protein
LREAKGGAAGRFAGFRRDRMAADENRKWAVARYVRDDQPIADARPEPARGGFSHAPRRFAHRETDVVRTFRSAREGRPEGLQYIFFLKHTLDEHTRIDGTNAGADNREQI